MLLILKTPEKLYSKSVYCIEGPHFVTRAAEADELFTVKYPFGRPLPLDIKIV